MTDILFILTVVSTIALDQSSEIEIEADSSTQNINTHESEWTGNVLAREGPYTLTADVIRLEYENDQPCRLIAVGKPVLAKGPMDDQSATAEGEVLLYDCVQQKARLARNAAISGGEHNIKAQNIIYDFIQGKLTATGTADARVKLNLNQRTPMDG